MRDLTIHKSMTGDGTILAGILERNVLTVVNGLEEICTSLITRQRSTTVGYKKSIIDFVVVSQNLVKHIKSMFIDDKRKHVLTSLRKIKNGIHKKESDHNAILTELYISYKQEIRSSRIEMLNLKDKEPM